VDHDNEIQRFKSVLIAAVVLLVAGYFSWQELKYKLWGKTAEATVTRTFEAQRSGRRGRRRTVQVVEYTYSEEGGTPRTAQKDFSLGAQLPETRFHVEYLSGEGVSRVAGDANWFAVAGFFGGLAWLGYSVYSIAREANAPIERSRRR